MYTSRAMSFKKKQQLYVTRRSERHHTQTMHVNNAHNKTLHHHNLGEEPKKPPQATSLSPTLCHGQSRNLLQAQVVV
jgi:hypothetical protein